MSKLRRELLGSMLSVLPRGSLVDLGTGHGQYALLAHRQGWQVTAVDARRRRWPADAPADIDWVQADVREFDLAPYDLVLCLGLFYHLTLDDQVALLRRATQPMIIDTHVDHGTHQHDLSDPVTIDGYEGRLYDEPGALTSSVGNPTSFWPTLESFRSMLRDCGFPVVLTADPWVLPDRAMFLAIPEGAAGAS